jgi:hypothetical protein
MFDDLPQTVAGLIAYSPYEVNQDQFDQIVAAVRESSDLRNDVMRELDKLYPDSQAFSA